MEELTMPTQWPISTGQVVAILGVPEHRITSQIRLGKINPPQIMGRRAWTPLHVLAVAKIIGKDSIALRNMCSAATGLNSGDEARVETLNAPREMKPCKVVREKSVTDLNE